MAYPKKDQLLERYFEYLDVERNASPRTLVAYRHALAKFKHFAAEKVSWQDCTAQNFRAFLLGCIKTGTARSYVPLPFAALRTASKSLSDPECLHDTALGGGPCPKT